MVNGTLVEELGKNGIGEISCKSNVTGCSFQVKVKDCGGVTFFDYSTDGVHLRKEAKE